MRVKIFLKRTAKVGIALGILGALVAVTNSFAGASQGVELTAVATRISGSIGSIAKILSYVALIAGIGFILASFFKFHQHKLNPTQVPLSQGITLLLIGSGLTLFPVMIPSARNAVVGTGADIGTLSGKAIGSLIGAS